MTDINLKLVIAIARNYNSIFSRIEKNVQEYGLNSSEFGVLEMLLHKGEQPVQKIADKILVTSGTITYIIDKLEKRELVYRKKCDKDKRIYYVCLSEKGELLISDVFQTHKKFLDDLFSGIDDTLKKEIVNDLYTLTKSLE
ncbi:MAG TPA: MarR family transcriptional regulator [Lachnospiraceae bacterium]|nr:MarR family transcriptional regulator [Lachnospiraceae bacterium]